MGTSPLVSVEEYLSTSYSPDREYRDGVVVERTVGNRKHALLQAALAAYIRRRRRSWNVEVFTDLRIRAREGWYPIPDVCIYQQPMVVEDVPLVMPLLVDRDPFSGRQHDGRLEQGRRTDRVWRALRLGD